MKTQLLNMTQRSPGGLFILSVAVATFLVCSLFSPSTANVQEKSQKPYAENQQAEAKTLVILDIGHGGRDKGAMANGVSERPLNEALANVVKETLIESGYSVEIVAAKDEFLGLSERAEQIEALAKKAPEGAVLISLHHHVSRKPNVKGLAVLIPGKPSPRFVKSKILANGIKNAYEAPVTIRNLAFKQLLAYSIPTMFIEAGYLSNKEEAKKVQTPAFREKVAKAVVNAVAAVEIRGAVKINIKTFTGTGKFSITADKALWSKDKKNGIYSGDVKIADGGAALASQPTLTVPNGQKASFSTGTVDNGKDDTFKATFSPILLPNGDIILEYSILDGKPITETLTPEDDVLVIQHQYLGGEAMSVITLSK